MNRVEGSPPGTSSPAPAPLTLRPAPSLAQAAAGDYLRLGDQGPAVLAVKERLAEAGFPLAEGAVFDAAMAEAVSAFQRRKRLAPDALVGPRTLAALGLLSAAPALAPRPAAATGQPATLAALAPPGSTPTPAPGGAGSAWLAGLGDLRGPAREQAILAEVARGNVPAFLTRFVEVPVSATDRQGVTHTGVVRVSPDYVAIGDDQSFVRVPMAQPTAEAIAARYDCVLPTRRLVDQIWAAATVRLAPQPMDYRDGQRMMSNAYTARHQELIEAARRAAGGELGALTAGHKKDLVLSNRQLQHRDRVAIYGWHQPNGAPIQPLSTVHEAAYADYSHGVRLVSRTMIVDGREMRIEDVLRDPNLAGLLSDEGPIGL